MKKGLILPVMPESSNRWGVRAYVMAWIAVVAAEYLHRNPHYVRSIVDSELLMLLLPLLLVALVGAWVCARAGTGLRGLVSPGLTMTMARVRGLALYLIVLASAIGVFAVFGERQGAFREGLLPAVLHFAGFSLVVHAAVFLIVVAAFVAGDRVLRLLSMPLGGMSRTLVAIALGFSVIGLMLFVLGAAHWVSRWTVGATLALILIPGARGALRFLRSALITPLPAATLNIWSALAVFVLLVFIGLNLTSALIPFPLGFDALRLYANNAHLISEYGSLTQGGQAYNWSLIASMGYTLFDSTPVALTLFVMPGILAVAAIWRLTRLVLSPGLAITAAALAYTIPVVTWQSSGDQKVDLALLYVVVTVVLVVAAHLRKVRALRPRQMVILCVVAGWLLGFAFGIKYTAAFALIGVFALLAWHHMGKWAWWAAVMLGFAAMFLGHDVRFGAVLSESASRQLMLITGAVGAGLLIWAGMRSRGGRMMLLKHGGVLAGAAFLAFSPWMIKHFIENNRVSLAAALEGKNAFQFQPDTSWHPPASTLTPDRLPGAGYQGASTDAPRTKGNRLSQGVREELTRYLGYEGGAARYLSLPYDVTMRANVPDGNLGTDPGFLALMLLPLLMLTIGRASFWFNLAGVMLAGLFWLLSVGSLAAQGKETLFSGVGNSFPATALWNLLSGQSELWSVLIATALMTLVWMIHRPALSLASLEGKIIIAFSATFGMFWLLFGSGVAWYGLSVLALVPPMAMIHLRDTGLYADKVVRVSVGVALGTWLLIATGLRLTDFEPVEAGVSGPYPATLMPYMSGEEDGQQTFRRVLNPAMAKAIETINSDPEARVLRVGTQITYFISANDKRVFEDNQLDYFAHLSQGGFQRGITRRLLRSEFKYIVVDLNTAALDRTPEQSLRQKFQNLMDYLTNSPSLKLIATDRMVYDPVSTTIKDFGNGPIPVRYSLTGQIIQPGSLAVMQIER